MILLSRIIKAEYVILDKRSNKTKNIAEQVDVKAINTPKEDLYEIYNQREIILKEANDESIKIINQAKRNAQTDIAESKKRGYEEGYNAGLEIGKNKGQAEGYALGSVKATEELQKISSLKINELTEMIQKVESEKQQIINNYEKDLTKLAIDIAEKIIKQKINESDSIISNIIKNAIKDYRNVDWIKVYISSSDDVIAIQADKNLINELNKVSNDVKIEVLEELSEGSVIVETPDGIVDSSISTQLKNLKEMVLSKNAG